MALNAQASTSSGCICSTLLVRPTELLAGLLLIFLCSISIPAQAMSRLFDGDAEVWTADDKVCFGGRTFKSSGLFFNRTLRVDSQRVVIHAVEVSAAGATICWSSSAAAVDDALPITSASCIAYGERTGRLLQRHTAKPLVDGLYNVMLDGSDLESGNRARFYKQFCMRHSDRQTVVTDAQYDEHLQRWSCAR